MEDTQQKEQQNIVDGTNQSSVIVDDTTLPVITEPVTTLTSASGMKFTVPEAFMEFCEQLMQEIKPCERKAHRKELRQAQG